METAPWTRPSPDGFVCVVRRLYVRYKNTFYIVMLYPPTVNSVKNYVALVRGGNDGVVLQMDSSTEFTFLITSGVTLRVKIWVWNGQVVISETLCTNATVKECSIGIHISASTKKKMRWPRAEM